MKRLQHIFLLILLLSGIAFSQFGMDKQHVSIKSYESSDKVHSGSEIKLAIQASVDKTWHINSNKPNEDFLIPSGITVVESKKNVTLTKTIFPDAKNITLGFSDKPLSVFEGDVLFGGLLKISDSAMTGDYTLIVTLDYQACNNATCLPPKSVSDTLHFSVVDKSVGVTENINDIFSKIAFNGPVAPAADNDASLLHKLEKSGLILSLILVFFGGLALNLTPCVYPLIPITIGFFGGQSEGSTKRLAMMGFLYLMGIALTYSIVGVVTALSGAVFGSLLQSPIVVISIVAVLVALSLSMFGVYEFKLPDALVQKSSDSKTGLFGAFFMGLTMGIVAAPCIGPFVLGLVTYVAALGDPLKGFLLFFFLALGLGSPYFVLALFSGKIKKLPRSGIWMEAVKHIFGFILLGMALYFAQPLFPKNISAFILPVFMVIAGLYLLIFEKAGNNLKGFKTFRIVLSLIAIILGVVFGIPTHEKSPNWSKYTEKAYQSAIEKKSPVIIDFYADWCIPCKELDKSTFSNEKVIKASERFTSLKADMTKSVSPEVDKLRNQFKIVGVPTVLIIDASGKEVKRITGFVSPEEFLKALEEAK